jgi:uncharacterized membrane protein YdjX (TVP38/TMEM64 family)
MNIQKTTLAVIGEIPFYKVLLYITLILLILVGLHYLNIGLSSNQALSQENMEAFILQAGIFSWLAYVLLLMLFVMSPLPSPLLTLVAGYLFNPLIAIVLTLLGEFLGSLGNFLIGRFLGKHFRDTEKFPTLHKYINKYKDHLDFRTIFFLGMIPIGTSNLTGYAAGISGMKFKKYLVPWMLGMTALSTIALLLGLSAKKETPHLSLIIIGAVTLALIISKIIEKKRKAIIKR